MSGTGKALSRVMTADKQLSASQRAAVCTAWFWKPKKLVKSKSEWQISVDSSPSDRETAKKLTRPVATGRHRATL